MPKDKGVNLFPGETFRQARCSYPGIATLFDRNLIGTANIPDGPSKEIFESLEGLRQHFLTSLVSLITTRWLKVGWDVFISAGKSTFQ
jgi:hypothetical protein